MRILQRLASFALILTVLLSNTGLPALAVSTAPVVPVDAVANSTASATTPLSTSPQATASSPQIASQSTAPQAQFAAPLQPSATATFSNSLIIDGSGYVSVTHNGALQPTVAATYEVWIRRTMTTSGCQAILGKDYTQAYWLGLCNDRIRFHSGGSGSAQDGT
ncbi:MAG TPA: hypothetical protein VLG46_16545, partial [Anaerolineae bacterium]|nr:hypothetical protein [Anaerolineae bacterium]